MCDKKSIIILLNDIAGMLEFKGENSFKVGAYRNGANSIRQCEDDISKLIENKSLDKIKGIGKGLQSVIYEYCTSGRSALHEELKRDVPDGIEQMLRVKGLSPKKIRILYDELGVSSVGELEYACKENRLKLLKGFGEASQDKILTEIENLRKYSSLILLSTAHLFAKEIESILVTFSSVSKINITGELRRGREIISSIEFVLLILNEDKFIEELGRRFSFEKSGNIISLTDYAAVPVKIYFVTQEKDFTGTLMLTTGPEDFFKQLTSKKIPFGKSEEGIFKKLDIPFIIPEMREHEYFSYTKKENSDLDIAGLKGMLHFHTTWSDGRNTLKEMVLAAKNRGYLYAAVCDHSKTAFYANGLNEERILLQNKELRILSKDLDFKIIQGIESDILQDGSLDYPAGFLSNFGFVVASIHSRYKMDEKSMTARILKAIENPNTDLLAHPSGRLLLSRDPYKFDIKRIIDACAANNVAIEINSNPRRLDIDWRHVNYAREKGCLFSINSDAHSIEEIDLVKYGIIMGRKGGLQKNELINCFSPEEFYNFVNRKVTRKNIW